jgi:hypothetical protein
MILAIMFTISAIMLMILAIMFRPLGFLAPNDF